ncbi:protein of unknown function [Saccharopolyspora kobensis]|uniref:eCIS core domain-containing protein n=1 Tax=Saccharopolyspora kobensis TaxID=146035 RepID=A0A1H5VQ48_9PSEU|nr:protein of unknown function [Saccharopolyspora kobensis]SFC58308.1 protein of unknown function [Saccharopolyspora kobensis]
MRTSPTSACTPTRPLNAPRPRSARAYSSGHHIVAGTASLDKHTLAHELSHVLQQRSGPVAGTDNGAGLSISDPTDRFEQEAEANARQVMSQGMPSVRDTERPQHAADWREAGRTVSPSAQPEAHADATQSGSDRIQRTTIKTKTKRKDKETKTRRKQTRRKNASDKASDKLVKDFANLTIAGKKTKGETVAELMKKELRHRGWKPYGATRTLTMHYTVNAENPAEAAKEENLKPPGRAKIYGGSENTVPPKSFKNDRAKQAIRWISTLALNYLNDLKKHPEEVQATLHNKVLYISSNTNAANNVLRQLAEKKATGTEFLKELIEANDRGSLNERQERHKNKARDRLTEEANPEAYAEIREALTAKPVVPENAKPDGKHAERRLADKVGRNAILTGPTAGTKRPCVACYVDLFQGAPGIRPGPYWPSKAANVGFDNYSPLGVRALADEIHRAIVRAGGTFASIQLQCPEHKTKVKGEASDVEMDAADETSAAGAAAGGRKKRASKNRVHFDTNTSSESSAGEEE